MPRNVRQTPATREQIETGIVSWLQFDYGALHVDGATIRRSVGGKLYVAFPGRRQRGRSEFAYLKPLTPEDRDRLERQLLLAVGLSLGAGNHG